MRRLRYVWASRYCDECGEVLTGRQLMPVVLPVLCEPCHADPEKRERQERKASE